MDISVSDSSRAKKEKREIRKRRKRAGRLSSGVNLGQIENSRGSTAQFVFLRLPEKMGRKGGRSDRWSIRFRRSGNGDFHRVLNSKYR